MGRSGSCDVIRWEILDITGLGNYRVDGGHRVLDRKLARANYSGREAGREFRGPTLGDAPRRLSPRTHRRQRSKYRGNPTDFAQQSVVVRLREPVVSASRYQQSLTVRDLFYEGDTPRRQDTGL